MANSDNVPAIEVRDLVKRYAKSKNNAVDGVSFDVRRGEIFGLLGPNGAGKTTTIGVLTTNVLPTSGAEAGRGGLSAADFVRVSTVQSLTRAGLRAIAPHGIALAEAEGLAAHANSIRLRQTDKS